jgi:hypothetical protein
MEWVFFSQSCDAWRSAFCCNLGSMVISPTIILVLPCGYYVLIFRNLCILPPPVGSLSYGWLRTPLYLVACLVVA